MLDLVRNRVQQQKKILHEIQSLRKGLAADERQEMRIDRRQRVRLKNSLLVRGQLRVRDAATKVAEGLAYADQHVRGTVSQEPSTATPDTDPQTFQELPPLLEGTQWESYLRDLVGGDTVEDSCAKLGDLMMPGGCRPNLAFLDYKVEQALAFDMPEMEARGPKVARSLRLLRSYKTEIRPLLAAALRGDDQGREEWARGLQAARDKYLGASGRV